MILIIHIYCFLFFITFSKCSLNVSSSLQIIKVSRLIDISSQIVKVTNKITYKNIGKESISDFIFIIEPQFIEHIALIRVQNSDSGTMLLISDIDFENQKAWIIKLDKTLGPGRAVVINVYYPLIDYLKTYPTRIKQNERQLVKFIGNCHFYSPYIVLTAVTDFIVGITKIENYSKVEPCSSFDNRISFGPYTNLSPLSVKQIEIHYENNSPFLIVSKLERKIEVSHWGNIAVSEKITLVHTGAKLKGPFSRHSFNRKPSNGISSVQHFKTILPAGASNIYYRDEIGNISTSHFYNSGNSVEVQLRPRFPLFGGWNTQYTLGYSLPSYSYLFSKGDNYLLKMPFIDLIYDNMVIKEAIIKIILPEGSRNVDLNLPYEAERLPDSLHYTYLDTIGKLVISIKKINLIEDHIVNFELRYIFPKMLMLLEPLLVITFVFLLFLTIIFYKRFDFSITKNENKKSQEKQ